MTVEEFAEVTASRIPTPAEFVAFAESQRWRFRVNGDGAAFLANKNDPLAIAFARMLSREPYRTNVLKLLSGDLSQPPATEPQPVRPPATKPIAPCTVCGRDMSDAEDRERLADPAFCDRGRDPRCPYKPKH